MRHQHLVPPDNDELMWYFPPKMSPQSNQEKTPDKSKLRVVYKIAGQLSSKVLKP